MLTHAEIYHTVVAARPEMAVMRLRTHHDQYGLCLLIDDAPCAIENKNDHCLQDALALIEKHWLKNLKQGESLCFSCDGWAVWGIRDGVRMLDPGSVDPFHALAEHFAPGSTKEKA